MSDEEAEWDDGVGVPAVRGTEAPAASGGAAAAAAGPDSASSFSEEEAGGASFEDDVAEAEAEAPRRVKVGALVEATAMAFGAQFAATNAARRFRGKVLRRCEDDGGTAVWKVKYDDDNETWETAERYLTVIGSSGYEGGDDDDEEEEEEEEEVDDDDDDDDDDDMDRPIRRRAAIVAKGRAKRAARDLADDDEDEEDEEAADEVEDEAEAEDEAEDEDEAEAEEEESSSDFDEGYKEAAPSRMRRAKKARVEETMRWSSRAKGRTNYAEEDLTSDEDVPKAAKAAKKRGPPLEAVFGASISEAPLAVERFLCRRAAPRHEWKAAMAKMNTAHITNGSMWEQEDDPAASQDGPPPAEEEEEEEESDVDMADDPADGAENHNDDLFERGAVVEAGLEEENAVVPAPPAAAAAAAPPPKSPGFAVPKSDDAEDDDVEEVRYLVKWKGHSFLHVSWELEVDLRSELGDSVVKRAMTTLMRRESNFDPETDCRSCDPRKVLDFELTQVERVVAIVGARDVRPREDALYAESSSSEEDEANGDSEEANGEKKAEEEEERLAGRAARVEARCHARAVALGSESMVRVKFRGQGYAETSEERWSDLVAKSVDQEALEAQLALCVGRLSPLKRRPDPATSKRAYTKVDLVTADGRDHEALKRRVLRAPHRGGDLRLRPYQHEGVAWLTYNLLQKRSSILADEMGLGKTVQACSTIRMAKEVYGFKAPALVVAPLSTLAHWEREFAHWTKLDVVVYHGSAADRDAARRWDLFARGGQSLSVDVVVTTYETLLTDDAAALANQKWSIVVVDEAHRLKNAQSRLYLALTARGAYEAIWRLLITGTPLQNDLGELHSLLSFVGTGPREFGSSAEDFAAKFKGCEQAGTEDSQLKDETTLASLQTTLKPYILRREKAHVERSVPPKEEVVVDVALAAMQKRYYRALYERNYDMLVGGGRAADGPSMMNLTMELRKCCNHPFLIKGVEGRERGAGAVPDVERLVDACGKLQFLDKMLPRLKQDGRRCLIFSQFTMMLDVLEDYLAMRGHRYARIDGGVTGRDRQRQIDEYSRPDSDMLVMLLSTRAGGVGINLVAADTVVIYDSDWNPQNDVQAMARCHRIGQTRAVKVYRLITKGTYEAHMYEAAAAKLDLDRAVLDSMATSKKHKGSSSSKSSSAGRAAAEEGLLRRGVAAFADDDDGDLDRLRTEDIDTILATRTRAVILKRNDDSGGALESLSSASFVAARGREGEDVPLDDPNFWAKTLASRDLKTSILPGSADGHPDLHIDGRAARAARSNFKGYAEAPGGVDDGSLKATKGPTTTNNNNNNNNGSEMMMMMMDAKAQKAKKAKKDVEEWSKTGQMLLARHLSKRPIGMDSNAFCADSPFSKREGMEVILEAARVLLIHYARSVAMQAAWKDRGGRSDDVDDAFDEAHAMRLVRRNFALRAALDPSSMGTEKKGPPDEAGALPWAEQTAALTAMLMTHEPPKGLEWVARSRDVDARNAKTLEAAHELEVLRIAQQTTLEAARAQSREIPGMKPARWWTGRHDAALVRGVLKHGVLNAEKRRNEMLADDHIGWPDDMPRGAATGAGLVASQNNTDDEDEDLACKPLPSRDTEASRGEKAVFTHLPNRKELNSRLVVLRNTVLHQFAPPGKKKTAHYAAASSSAAVACSSSSSPRKQSASKKRPPPTSSSSTSSSSDAKATGDRPLEIYDESTAAPAADGNAPSSDQPTRPPQAKIPKKSNSKAKENAAQHQASITSFFCVKQKPPQ